MSEKTAETVFRNISDIPEGKTVFRLGFVSDNSVFTKRLYLDKSELSTLRESLASGMQSAQGLKIEQVEPGFFMPSEVYSVLAEFTEPADNTSTVKLEMLAERMDKSIQRTISSGTDMIISDIPGELVIYRFSDGAHLSVQCLFPAYNSSGSFHDEPGLHGDDMRLQFVKELETVFGGNIRVLSERYSEVSAEELYPGLETLHGIVWEFGCAGTAVELDECITRMELTAPSF